LIAFATRVARGKSPFFSKALGSARPSADARKTSGDVLKRADLDLSDYLPYLINRVGAALVERFTAEALRDTHLTIGLWRLLVVMSNHDGTRQVDLAKLTSIEVSTVSRLVTRLIQLGLVTRSRSAKSSREVIVELSAKGSALVASLVPIAVALEQAAIGGVPKKELATVRRVLKQMHLNLAEPTVLPR
jgi:DNA-binding MarR family transcriptional regulator